MSFSDIVYASVYLGGAVILSIIAVLTVALVAGIGKYRPSGFFPYLFMGILLTLLIPAMLSGRNLSYMSELFAGEVTESLGGVIWFNRAFTAIALMICLDRIFFAFSSRRYVRLQGAGLFAGFFVYAVTNYVANGMFGTHPTFSQQYIYPILAMSAAFVAAKADVIACIRMVKTGLLIMLVSSFVAAIIKPSMVAEVGYAGILPGVHFRYWGLASHANTLGPLALVFLLCLWHHPFNNRSLHVVAVAVGLASFLLAQSKTSMLAAILAFGILIFARFREQLRMEWKSYSFGASSFGVVIVFCLLIPGVLSIPFFMDIDNAWHSFLSTKEGASVASLTGRDVIWSLAFNEWQHSPWFGYGPSMWDLEYRMSVGLIYAFHAHNQLMQSLSTAGIVGVFGLLLYLVLLCFHAFSSFNHSKGLSVALLAIVMFRGISEVPLALSGFGGSEFFVHLLLFVVCLGYLKQKPQDNSQATGLAV